MTGEAFTREGSSKGSGFLRNFLLSFVILTIISIIRIFRAKKKANAPQFDLNERITDAARGHSSFGTDRQSASSLQQTRPVTRPRSPGQGGGFGRRWNRYAFSGMFTRTETLQNHWFSYFWEIQCSECRKIGDCLSHCGQNTETSVSWVPRSIHYRCVIIVELSCNRMKSRIAWPGFDKGLKRQMRPYASNYMDCLTSIIKRKAL